MGAECGPTRLVPRGTEKFPAACWTPARGAGAGCRSAYRIGRKISVSVSVFSSSVAGSQFSHRPPSSRSKS